MSDDRTVALLAFLVAVGYIVVGATHFLLPHAQLQSSATLVPSLIHDGSGVFRLHYWAFAITSLLAIGLVIGVRPESRTSLFLRLSRVWAVIAFGLTAIDFLYVQQRAVNLAAKWDSLDEATRNTIAALGTGRIDATWFIGFGLIIAWPLALARSLRGVARVFAVLVSIIAALVCAGSILRMPMLVNIAAAGAIVVNPVWFVAIGIDFMRRSNESM